MNLGGDAADQMVRYSLEGIDHGLRLSGSIAKNLAVFFAAVLKDQKKTHGRTNMLRMLKDSRPLKFFTVPSDRIREFCKEGKKRGLLYVVIRDRKNPEKCELMVFADDAAKVNRVMDQMNLDFVKSESGSAAHEVVQNVSKDLAVPEPVRTETVSMPDGDIQFEISELDEEFNIQGAGGKVENFTKAQEMTAESLSEHSLRNSDSFIGPERVNEPKKPSVRKDLNQIKKEKQESNRKKRQKNKNRNTRRQKKKMKAKGKGR